MSAAESFRGPDWRPVTDGGIGRKKPRRNQRTRAHRGTIAEIREEKCSGACRLCGDVEPLEAHHLIPRSHLGRWHRDNIVGLCQVCHRQVTENDGPTLACLAASLTDSEYAFLIEEMGEGALSRLFGVMSR